MELLQKEVRNFHNKTLYLLGKDEDGTRYYLESPSWDCDWYWGFGYIEGFSGKTISDRAHESHERADDFMSKWFTEWNGSKPRLAERTFSEKEGWQLSELFKSFYILKETAALLEKGSAHVSDNPAATVIQDAEYARKINQEKIPAITACIIKILKV